MTQTIALSAGYHFGGSTILPGAWVGEWLEGKKVQASARISQAGPQHNVFGITASHASQHRNASSQCAVLHQEVGYTESERSLNRAVRAHTYQPLDILLEMVVSQNRWTPT